MTEEELVPFLFLFLFFKASENNYKLTFFSVSLTLCVCLCFDVLVYQFKNQLIMKEGKKWDLAKRFKKRKRKEEDSWLSYFNRSDCSKFEF